MKRLLVLAATVAVTTAGAPAQAVCSGCGGGAVTPGYAEVSTLEEGALSSDVLHAGCEYRSNGVGEQRGSLRAWAYATEPVDATAPYVTVQCRLYFTGVAGVTYVDDAGSVRVGRSNPAPPDLRVERLCLQATAEWYRPPSWSQAEIVRCVYPGLTASAAGLDLLRVPLPE